MSVRKIGKSDYWEAFDRISLSSEKKKDEEKKKKMMMIMMKVKNMYPKNKRWLMHYYGF
jgi:hypothetical protein